MLNTAYLYVLVETKRNTLMNYSLKIYNMKEPGMPCETEYYLNDMAPKNMYG